MPLYLDNAATSFPKPPAVIEAVARYMSEIGATPGRASYASSLRGGEIIALCRRRLIQLFNASHPENVVFTLNTTDALNLAIKGVARARRRTGAKVHAVTTAMDHNSVLRPLNAMAAQEDLAWTCVDVDPHTGLVDPRAIEEAIGPDTALVVLNHASNVTGVIQPAREIGEICRRRGVLFLLDAAQSAGHIPVDVEALSVDLLAFPGHKGLLGPLGTGGLWIRPGVEDRVDPLREGGTGTSSDADVQPLFMPDRYEPGSHNAPGIAGLGEAVEFLLRSRDASGAWPHERELIGPMLEGLRELSPAYRLVGPSQPNERVGIFTIVHEHLDARTLARRLEQEHEILARPGVHCAPRAHRALGTLGLGGAVRLSLGPFVTPRDIERTIAALRAIGASARGVERVPLAYDHARA